MLGIVLSRLKVTPEAIKDDLMGMDEKLLTKEKVVALIKCVPTADEVLSLLPFSIFLCSHFCPCRKPL